MATLYHYFRLAYKHLLHGNKISDVPSCLYYRRFLLFFFFFFYLVVHRTSTAKVLTRHSLMQALFLSQFVLDISYNTLSQMNCVRHVNSFNKQLTDLLFQFSEAL